MKKIQQPVYFLSQKESELLAGGNADNAVIPEIEKWMQTIEIYQR